MLPWVCIGESYKPNDIKWKYQYSTNRSEVCIKQYSGYCILLQWQSPKRQRIPKYLQIRLFMCLRGDFMDLILPCSAVNVGDSISIEYSIDIWCQFVMWWNSLEVVYINTCHVYSQQALFALYFFTFKIKMNDKIVVFVKAMARLTQQLKR